MIQWIKQWWQRRHTDQITFASARERVARGADYLDEVDPGWHHRVDPSSLELADGQFCVLGQLHGDFRLGLGRTHLINLSSAPRASLSPVTYGFQCVQNVPPRWRDLDYEFLTRAWRAAVRDRRPEPSGDGARGALPEWNVRSRRLVHA